MKKTTLNQSQNNSETLVIDITRLTQPRELYKNGLLSLVQQSSEKLSGLEWGGEEEGSGDDGTPPTSSLVSMAALFSPYAPPINDHGQPCFHDWKHGTEQGHNLTSQTAGTRLQFVSKYISNAERLFIKHGQSQKQGRGA